MNPTKFPGSNRRRILSEVVDHVFLFYQKFTGFYPEINNESNTFAK